MKYKILVLAIFLNLSQCFYATWPEAINEISQIFHENPYNSQAITDWIQANPRLLDYPMNNGQSPLYQLLNYKDINNFRFALYTYWQQLNLNSITRNNHRKRKHKGETILHALCRKGIDQAPDLSSLISFVLQINPYLANAIRGDGKNAAIIALNNSHIDDFTTLNILQTLRSYDPNTLTYAQQYICNIGTYNTDKINSLGFIFPATLHQYHVPIYTLHSYPEEPFITYPEPAQAPHANSVITPIPAYTAPPITSEATYDVAAPFMPNTNQQYDANNNFLIPEEIKTYGQRIADLKHEPTNFNTEPQKALIDNNQHQQHLENLAAQYQYRRIAKWDKFAECYKFEEWQHNNRVYP